MKIFSYASEALLFIFLNLFILFGGLFLHSIVVVLPYIHMNQS